MFVGVFENNNSAHTCGLMVWHFAPPCCTIVLTGFPDVFMRRVSNAAANKYFTLAVFQKGCTVTYISVFVLMLLYPSTCLAHPWMRPPT